MTNFVEKGYTPFFKETMTFFTTISKATIFRLKFVFFFVHLLLNYSLIFKDRVGEGSGDF